jgi:hypothetical protein
MVTDRKSGGDAIDTQGTGPNPQGYGDNPAFPMGANVGVLPPEFPFKRENEESQSNPDQEASASAQGGEAGTDNKVYGS